MTTAKQIIAELRRMFPESLGMDWDTTQGLIAGDPSKIVKRAVVSLEFRDNTPKRGADMIILHHPPIFGPQDSITNPFYSKWKQTGEVVYAIHSRIDVSGFMGRAIAERLFEKAGYRFLKTLGDGTVIIELRKQTPIREITRGIKSRLKLGKVNAIIKKQTIKRIGIHGGEAFQLHHITDAMRENVDLYLGGDMTHHLAEQAHAFKASFIDIGHSSEQEGMRKLSSVLQDRFPDVHFRYIEQKQLWTSE